MSFDAIFIIYNPNSTGNSVQNAKELKIKLVNAYPNLKIKLCQTEYAGHAEKLAYKLSTDSKSPLIVSSSGDGGYNEVINGAIKAQKEGASPICAVLASGNANDHSRTLVDDTLFTSIICNKPQRIDLLKLKIENHAKVYERYAHSYIGFGLTPVVAVELNKTDLNAFKELMIILRTFYRHRPFRVKRKNQIQKLDSIIFANIGEMAKMLTISKHSKPDDGLFEVVTFKHGHKLRLLRRFVKATVSGLDTNQQFKSYKFTNLKNTPAQLDGEVINIKKSSSVQITSEHRMLETII